MPLEQYPSLRPKPGLVFEAYVSRRDIGSGLKLFVVYMAGRKYVHLFYGPRLASLRLTNTEFHELYMQPVLHFDAATFKRNLQIKIDQAHRFGHRFRKDLLTRVCTLDLTNGLELFGEPTAPAPIRNVKRG